MNRATRLEGMQTEQEAVVSTLAEMTEEQWRRPSGCPGWSVHDVVAHMASELSGLFGTLIPSLALSNDLETRNERAVQRRRRRTHQAVATEYERWAPRARALAEITSIRGVGNVPIRLAELGWVPLALVPSFFAFDTYVHLREDIAPATGVSLPCPTDATLAAVCECMAHAAARLGRDSLDFLRHRAITFHLTGVGESIWSLRHDGERLRAHQGCDTRSVTEICSPTTDYVRWATGRALWDESDVVIAGDEAVGERVLDNLLIY